LYFYVLNMLELYYNYQQMTKQAYLLTIIVALMLSQCTHSSPAGPYTYPDWVESTQTAECSAIDSTS
jgi:hypothetical protein